MEVGQTLGHYSILEKLGAGGMGEVYLAEDTRLGREVAIKVLPEEFVSDPERLARFEREAKVLASLNHPHIAQIYGLEEIDGERFLVLELVDGPTLAERIKKGPIPVEEALPFAIQIANALEAAHENGVVHRDLKPANIKLTLDGEVKVLDFGLAKPVEAADSPDLTQSPTLTYAPTQAGVLLGTAAYMSPEQTRGQEVDKRSDIWAFGCCLFEMLTGKAGFPGETVSDTIARVLERQPEWASLPTSTPAIVRSLLHRCLQKDPNQRLHDIADARIEIEEALSGTFPPGQDSPPVLRARPRLATATLVGGSAFAGLVIGVIAAGIGFRGSAVREVMRAPTARFAIDLPDERPLEPALRPAVAVAPDGSSLVYVARYADDTELVLRQMNGMDQRPIPGTKGASGPFYSPNGEFISFHADGKLVKVPISGGAPVPLADASAFRGGTWGSAGKIIFTAAPGTGLWSVGENGGDSQILTDLDLDKDERTHRWPHSLPDGMHVLFTVRRGFDPSFDRTRISRLAVSSGKIEVLFEGGSDARYVPTGHLVFVRSGTLMAVPYDAAENRVSGAAVQVIDGVMSNPRTGAGQFALSTTGTLAYIRGDEWIPRRMLLSLTPGSPAQPVTESKRPFESPRLSPDGKRLAVVIEGINDDIWIYDLNRDSPMRLTFEAGSNWAPVWYPDGTELTFSSNRAGVFNLYRKQADGSQPAERLTTSDDIQFAGSWSPDGRVLAFTQIARDTGPGIWLYEAESAQEQPFLDSAFAEVGPIFSPDGQWLAYTSDESGRQEVYVQPFPGPGGKWQISTDGGGEPLWAPDGRHLFYRSGSQLIGVAVAPGSEFVSGAPQIIFDDDFERSPASGIRNYDAAPGRNGFLLVRSQPQALPRQINVVLNWFEELKHLASTED